MIYSMVDESYDVTLVKSVTRLVEITGGVLFLENRKRITKAGVVKFFKENPLSNLYLYQDPDDVDNRNWYYRVERHS